MFVLDTQTSVTKGECSHDTQKAQRHTRVALSPPVVLPAAAAAAAAGARDQKL